MWSAGLPVSCQSPQSQGRAIVGSFAGLAGWASGGCVSLNKAELDLSEGLMEEAGKSKGANLR